MTQTRQGGCRCGKVRFEVSGDPLLTIACHCIGCQHMTASAFSLSEGYSADALRLTAGETVMDGLHQEHRHHHCEHCKSWLYTEPHGVEGYVNVRSTMFDEPRSEPPFVECYLSESLPWARIDAVHGYEKFPAMDEWPKLIEEFASARAAATEETSA